MQDELSMNFPKQETQEKQMSEFMTSQDILDFYGITEYNVGDLVKDFENAMAYKQEQARIFKILDAADHSDIWKVFNKKIPTHVQTPTHNPITIIKEATKSSIIPTEYSGEFKPLSFEAKDVADRANKFFEAKWEAMDMNAINDQVGEYAFLHGTSGVLFGWNNDIVDGADISTLLNKKRLIPLQAKVYHPTNIFPDPSANCVEEMSYMAFAERKPKDFLKAIPRFQPAINAIENPNDTTGYVDNNYVRDKAKQWTSDVVTFITMYKKVFRQKPDTLGVMRNTPSYDIIYMAGRNILDIAKDIQPACIPFVTLYDEKVPNNFWGISKCYKVLSLYLALVQLDSTEATSYFQHQNPAEFINTMAGINIAEYQNKKDNPERAFTVNCDPRVVQAYAQRPELPKNIDAFRQYLINAIQEISGVDAAYLGRSYGSVQTTGGVQSAIDRATMRDNNRIKNIDKFIKSELDIITQFYILHGSKESFMASNSNMHQTDVPGVAMVFDPMELFGREDIIIEVSNVAPRSNASYEQAAKDLMELQMKYQPSMHGYPDFISPLELVGWLNIPKSQKNVLVDRMTVQMQNMKTEEYMAVLTAIGTLTNGGMPVEMALQEVVAQMTQTPIGQTPATNPTPQQPMQK